jgi:tRNA isopentenyl-2-thiomethyl-A-37 hydroxylase MiaE
LLVAPVEAFLQIETTLAQDKKQIQIESENTLAIIRDVYYMKQMAVEVVSQLALDTMASMPTDSAIFSQLLEQVQEEYQHLNRCRSLLAKRGALGTRPGYVRRFVSVMRTCAKKRRRTLPLAAAVILCIAVERSAMQQLGRITTADREITELFRELGADEEEHYRLVTGVAAPCAAAMASLTERAWAHLLMLRLALITLVYWWPSQRETYRACGLNTEIFLLDVLEYVSKGLLPIKLFFPRRAVSRLARLSLGIS